MEKGVSKIPLEMSRLTDEDLVNIELEERQAKSRSEDSSTGERAQSIYCRSSDCEKAELEDFELIKVIG